MARLQVAMQQRFARKVCFAAEVGGLVEVAKVCLLGAAKLQRFAVQKGLLQRFAEVARVVCERKLQRFAKVCLQAKVCRSCKGQGAQSLQGLWK